ncbi:FHA domain-containing protein [Luteimicrobium sp. NPDC057192]|uniref:FHA domain-containing protein n=1 Tax=Luteimicrobium sp. NPDC057192 TaxID=3346042 RepID=UPI0036347CA2
MSGSTGAGPARTARYVPGAGNVVVRGDVLVALPYAPADRSAAVWDALDGAAGVMDALQVLSSTFDAGLAALPPFAVVVLTSGGRAHVLVRGDVEVRVDGHDGPTDLHGRDVSTWTERAVEGVEGVSVRLGTSAGTGAKTDDAPTTLPLVGGVVRAKAVSWGSDRWVHDAATSGEAHAAAAAGIPPVEPVAPHAEDAAGDVAKTAAPTTGVPTTGVLTTGVAERDAAKTPDLPALVTAVPGLGAASELTLAPMETIAPGSDATEEPTEDVVEPAGDAPGGSTDADAEAPAAATEPETAPADDAPPAADQPVADEYESLWETTIHRSVEEAAVRLEESDEEDDAAPVTALVSGVPRDFAPVPPAPAPPSAAPPAAPAAEPAASPAAGGPDGFDHDGHTVMGSSVSDLRAVAAAAAAQLAASGELPAFAAGPGAAVPAAEQPVAGPPLVARPCPSGHANPPSREHCASCGAPLSGQTQTVARPPLGRVRVTTGEGGDPQVFPLDRPLVVGRRPRSPKGAGGGGEASLHRIVTVASPQQDISRSHVEVRLEGWNVLAVDLNTTNGTTLLRPGQSPLRLHPGDPQLVVSGDVVDLGDGVTLAFEEVP